MIFPSSFESIRRMVGSIRHLRVEPTPPSPPYSASLESERSWSGESELEKKKPIESPEELKVEELLYTRSASLIYVTRKSSLDLLI